MNQIKNVSPWTGGGGTVEQAFTMAEILLSLTIIGVVAAITLPSLTGNINERTWNTQRKALYARMSQAIALMPALNGYGTLTEDADNNVTEDTAAETFITSGLSKVLKINNICDNEHLADCGVPTEYTNMQGSKKNIPTTLYGLNPFFHMNWREVDGSGSPVGSQKTYHQANTKAAAFETQNGESILAFYNPYCQAELGKGSLEDFAQSKMCANFIYDLNGNKGPNTMGKDIGVMSIIYPSDSVVVAPVPIYSINDTFVQQDASKACQNKDSEARLPNIEEFMSLAYNQQFIGPMGGDNGHFWTSTLTSSSSAKTFHLGMGRIYSHPRTKEYSVQCVKRN